MRCQGRHSLLVGFLLFLTLAGCREERKVDVAATLNPKGMPTMTTVNVNTLISDSGVVQYKIVTPLWKMYEEVDTPYWEFPKGLYLRRFDTSFNVIATVAADSARYLVRERLWTLMGHVEMTSAPDKVFFSERFYYDQGRRKIYSDTFIHVETATHVLEGTGFESNDELTAYRILNPQGIFPVKKP